MSGVSMDADDTFDDFIDEKTTQRLRELVDSDNEGEEAVLFSDDEGDEEDYQRVNESDPGFNGFEYDDHDDEDDDDYDMDDEEEGAEDSAEESEDETRDHEEEDASTSLARLGFDDDEDEDEFHQNASESEEDEDFMFRNALREATNFKVKSKKGAKKKGSLAELRRRVRRNEPPPEVKQKLSEANEAFVRNDFQAALDLYQDVVKIDPNNFSAYKTLGEIYRVQGNYTKCSNFWLLAAHIHPWDFEFWRTLAELSVELGHERQALYCYSKAVRASNGQDYESIFARACLNRDRKKFRRAIKDFLHLRALMPSESRILRELAKAYVDQNRINDAITMYNKVLEENVKNRRLKEKDTGLNDVVFDWSELNILCELVSNVLGRLY
ncbi:unnamed protein product [Ambrosiozyma monospora]|uniref:Unnamed protein product n=1 Tax=Ambrosiozyma monospora TaxID=43982 RepID=A0ACB5T1Q8_AMBMO|nr:unnamed protein product [Ambrosiozyma monospora]